MKRVGKRGSGQFERISWEEAYELSAQKLNQYKTQYGGKSVCFFSGFAKWYRAGLMRLASAFGTPNYCLLYTSSLWLLQLIWAIRGRKLRPAFLTAGNLL